MFGRKERRPAPMALRQQETDKELKRQRKLMEEQNKMLRRQQGAERLRGVKTAIHKGYNSLASMRASMQDAHNPNRPPIAQVEPNPKLKTDFRGMTGFTFGSGKSKHNGFRF